MEPWLKVVFEGGLRGTLLPLSQEGDKSVVVGQEGWKKLRESDLITSLLVLWR